MRLKTIPWTLAVLLMATVAAVHQTNADCPKLEVIPPRGMMNVNKASTFVLKSDQDYPESYSYKWSVDDGATIVSGQGSRVVEIVAHLHGTSVRATVNVTGLPAQCASSASEIVGVEPRMEWESLDEWGEIPNDDQRGRLDLLFAELANNPTHRGLLYIYAKSSAIERRRLKLVLEHARFRKFDKNLLVFCVARSSYTSTRVYRVPPSLMAEIPSRDCKLIDGSLLK